VRCDAVSCRTPTIALSGLIARDWQKRLPHNSAPMRVFVHA
jgi:ABC-type sulfate transport system substrate-binding protein